VDTQTLVERTYGRLGIGKEVFWPFPEVVENGLNPAQRILCLLKPDLYTLRTLAPRGVDDPVIDLRSAAPSAWRMQRIALGNITLVPPKPVPTQGRLGDLRKISLTSLRGQRDWMTRLAPRPSHWYTHGLHLIGTWPRATQPVTLTLVYAAMPPALAWSAPTQEAALPVQWHPVIADLAANLLMLKEGKGECQQAIAQMETLVKAEPLRQLLKQMRAEQYREQALAQKASA